MKSLPVGEFKANFSSVIKEVQGGEPVTITYGKKKDKLAVLVPYEKYVKQRRRNLGLLVGKATFKINEDWKMSEEELLGS
ncbi:MAG: type II toxin-antitoxin system Phd/YefM family antitoxin [Planctomycetota bacterium]|nr:type II toxin-antitoxin system Phd/YefM family antitoxin [Planctomycetota bacterium]MDA1137026.1 type II toxin-antitoxin system Phd/YefM family antitoxin [Planctomycetota bacterium]